MTILPISSARVSTLERATQSASTIGGVESQIQAVGQELSSGLALTVPSDDPSAAVVIQTLRTQLSDSAQYATNVTAATTQLNNVDSVLANLGTLVTQATSTAQGNDTTISTAAERESAAETIDGIYDQVVSTANTQYGGRYVFGTDDATAAPYQVTNGGVEYTASDHALATQTDSAERLSYQVTGSSVFGGASASVSTGTDLAPALTAADRIVDLAGARNAGVTLGTVNISNGTTTTAVDLSGADTVQDVVDDINSAGIAGVAASVTPAGLKLTASGGANVTVTDPDGSTAAADLGIARVTAGGADVAVTGVDPVARVTPLTKLSDLNGGAGLDPAGFTITNGTAAKTITLAGLTTVQDLVNAVNASGTGVRATIRTDGSGVDLTNNTQGTDLTVSEAGGTTAAQLGFNTFKGTTKLASLNKGAGVAVPAGTQFTIATADGSKVSVGLTAAASTVQDAVDQINAAAGGKVTASLSTTSNGIVLTDHTAGTGKLAVTAVDAAATAADLGLTTGTVTGNTLSGADVNPVATPGLLTDLNDLRVALRADDAAGIDKATAALENDSDTVATVRGVVGARVQELTSRTTSLASQDTDTQTLLSSVQDVDYTQATTQYQLLQTSLQASLEITSQSMNLSLMNYLS